MGNLIMAMNKAEKLVNEADDIEAFGYSARDSNGMQYWCA